MEGCPVGAVCQTVSLFLLQDKVKGTEEEKEAAAKRFAEIGHGMPFPQRLECVI